MVDEKDKKDSAKEAAKSEKATKTEEAAKTEESAEPKQSLFDKVKKYLLPAGIGIGSMLVMLAIYILVLGDKPVSDNQHQENDEVSESSMHESDAEVSKKHDSEQHIDSHESSLGDNVREVVKKGNVIDTVILSDNVQDGFVIDTAEILRELNEIFITPEQEQVVEGMTPQDSVDTLNWLEKEQAELDKKIAEFEKKRKELEILENKINKSLLKIEQAESTRIINLARLYDGMKPDEIGRLFANLSDEIVISILPRMKPANASKILALLPPKRAARISTSMITVLEDN